MAHFERTRNQVPVTSSFKLTYRRWLLCINARTRVCTRGRVFSGEAAGYEYIGSRK